MITVLQIHHRLAVLAAVGRLHSPAALVGPPGPVHGHDSPPAADHNSVTLQPGSRMIAVLIGGRGGAMVIVLRSAPIMPINGPSVMRLMARDLVCIALS